MKKFLILLVAVFSYSNVTLAKTADEMCQKYELSAQKQIEKVDNYKTYNDQMKETKKKAIQAQAEIKCNLAKDMQKLREEKRAEKKAQRKNKKA